MSLSVFSTIPGIHSIQFSTVSRKSAVVPSVVKRLSRNFSLRAVPLSTEEGSGGGGLLFGEAEEIEEVGIDEFEDEEEDDFSVDLEKLEKEAEDVAREYSQALLTQLVIDEEEGDRRKADRKKKREKSKPRNVSKPLCLLFHIAFRMPFVSIWCCFN